MKGKEEVEEVSKEGRKKRESREVENWKDKQNEDWNMRIQVFLY